MAANPVNRKTLRNELASLLETNVAGTGNVAQAVYSSDRRDFAGQSPVVCVISAGRVRTPFGMTKSKWYNRVPIGVLLYVARSDGEAGYTAENAEDALDDLERAVAAVVMDNRNHVGYWNNLEFGEEASVIAPVVVGGQRYFLEILTVWVVAHD